MISLEIIEKKKFVSWLLVSEIFDQFLLIEATIITGNTYHIEGKIQPSFYTSEELEESGRNLLVYDYWHNFKQTCYGLIKGKKTPLQFKVILALAPQNIEKLLVQTGLPLTASNINGLYLNIQFTDNNIHCITGTSLNLFTLDKSLEQAWDSMIQKFFHKHKIPFRIQ